MYTIKEVKTFEELKKLYDGSAMTWEGLKKESFVEALKECSYSKDAWGYYLTGKTMNKLCRLSGDNAYPDSLTIFSILDSKGLAITVGARWMDDIIDNNARREGYHPFNEDFEDFEREEDDE